MVPRQVCDETGWEVTVRTWIQTRRGCCWGNWWRAGPSLRREETNWTWAAPQMPGNGRRCGASADSCSQGEGVGGGVTRGGAHEEDAEPLGFISGARGRTGDMQDSSKRVRGGVRET